MVEFCQNKGCKQSLPVGDMTIRKGKKFTSHDYPCPHCGKLANPSKETVTTKKAVDPQPDKDIVISGGNARIE
jgi:hypothetical protein